MGERRQLRANVRETGRIDVADHDAGAVGTLGDARPGDRSAPTGRRSGARRGALRPARRRARTALWRARAAAGASARGPGGGRERGRNEQQRRRPQCPGLREAQVVADRQPDPSAGQVDRHRLATGFDGPRLVVRLVALREGEQVDLVVAGKPPAVRAVDEAGAAHAGGIGAGQRDRPADHPGVVPAGGAREKFLLRTDAVLLLGRELVGGGRPTIPKYSGSTISRAPSSAAAANDSGACARVGVDVAGRETDRTAATRNASAVIAGSFPGLGAAVAAPPRVTTGSDELPATVAGVAEHLLDRVLDILLREQRRRLPRRPPGREEQQRRAGRHAGGERRLHPDPQALGLALEVGIARDQPPPPARPAAGCRW